MPSSSVQGPSAQRPRWPWIALVIVLLLAILGGGYWHYQNRGEVVQIEPGVTLTKARQGAVIADFPKDLIPEEGVALTSSYRIDYSQSGAKQSVVEYLSAKNVEGNLHLFRSYFVENGWQMSQTGKASEQPTFIFATKDSAQANISLQALPAEEAGKTKVSVTYLVNK